MKTFKLKSFEVIEKNDKGVESKIISFHDGLIINREDAENHWIIEAYMENSYVEYFRSLQKETDKILIQVKISKESNDPALFATHIIGINEINSRINVLFKGTIIDQRRDKLANMLKTLIDKGYQDEKLLSEFKALLRKG